MDGLLDVEPSCAICGASSPPECPHESQRLELAVEQALERWTELQRVRQWILREARDEVITRFEELKRARYTAHVAYLQTLPCFTLYQQLRANPQAHYVNPSQLQMVQQQIGVAQAMYKAGVDEDWRRSCMRYPETLDYYLSLVTLDLPDDRDSYVQGTRSGMPVKAVKRIKARRSSHSSTDRSNGHRKKERRRQSRGRTPHRR